MHRTSHEKANQQGPGVAGLLIGLYQMSKPTAEAAMLFRPRGMDLELVANELQK